MKNPNLSDLRCRFLQIQFESDQIRPLGQVTLPASLLAGVSLSDAEQSSLSRINFMFFSSTNLFQVSREQRHATTVGRQHRVAPSAGLTTLITHFTVFQKEQLGRSLNSYVVASSVGNFSVRDLPEPVRIEIAHLSQQVCACVCVPELLCLCFVFYLFF